LKTVDRFSDLESVADSQSEHTVHTHEQSRRTDAQTLSSLHL